MHTVEEMRCLLENIQLIPYNETASFSSVPREVVIQIADTLHPRHILNFALSCKTNHAAATGALRKHQHFAKQYKRIANYSHHESSVQHVELSQLLNEVRNHSFFAYYIKGVSLTFDCTLDSENAQPFESAVDELTFGSEEQKKQWKKGLRDCTLEVVAALVLLHLPRLSLFEWRSSNHGRHSLFLDIIGDAAKSGELPDLKSLLFRSKMDGRDLALNAVSPFLAIKSLRIIQAKDSHCLDSRSTQWSCQSEVSELGISVCEDNARVHFDSLLEHLPALERLDFLQPCACNFETIDFCREVAKRAVNLVSLYIRSGQTVRGDEVGDFSVFRNLRNLAVHFHLFISQEKEHQPPPPLSLSYLHLIQHPRTNMGDYVGRVCEMVAPESGQLLNLENLDLTCQKSYGDWESYAGGIGKLPVRLLFQEGGVRLFDM